MHRRPKRSQFSTLFLLLSEHNRTKYILELNLNVLIHVILQAKNELKYLFLKSQRLETNLGGYGVNFIKLGFDVPLCFHEKKKSVFQSSSTF